MTGQQGGAPAPPAGAPDANVCMSRDDAARFRAAYDFDVRTWSRMSKAALLALLKSRRQWVPGYGPERWSKDEMISALAEARYPIKRLHEAIHVLHHGEWTNSACEWCAGGGL